MKSKRCLTVPWSLEVGGATVKLAMDDAALLKAYLAAKAQKDLTHLHKNSVMKVETG